MKKLVFYGLAVLAIVVLFFAAVLEDKFVFNLKEKEVEAKIVEALPQEVKKLGANLKIKKLNTDFLAENKILIKTEFDFEGYGVKGVGEAKFMTSIDYRGGEFYLKDPVLNKESYTIKIEEGQSVIANAKQTAKGYLNKLKNKLSEKEDEKSKKSFDALVVQYAPKVKEFVINNAKLQIQNIPIYSLNDKDVKHSLAALALKDVKFKEQELEVTLSPMMFLGKITLFIVGGILVFFAGIGYIFAFVRGGGGFLPFL